MRLLLILPLLFLGYANWAQKTTFSIVGVANKTGLLRVAVYQTETDFKKESTDLLYSFKKEELILGFMQIELDLKPGKYVIAFLDDTNKDAKMNYNLIGIPKEGYAFSNLKKYGYSKPSFKEASIEVKEGVDNSFEIKFNYF